MIWASPGEYDLERQRRTLNESREKISVCLQACEETAAYIKGAWSVPWAGA